ncbi:MAG: hypothetical protein HOM11_00265 [Methylococcales bacterium]|jgi:HD-GYP domain-containing protein (c-di-GMP phosphodiesterase class II)|nr:hypothetical protein [Methylococcales bacterium]MBT7444679.1 hypothetical protein [Methylococcales bacterium]
MAMQAVTLDELVVRKPLKWAIFDKNGNQVMDVGAFIASEKQAKRLITRGVFREVAESDVQPAAAPAEPEQPKKPLFNIFTSLDEISEALKKGFYFIIHARPCWESHLEHVIKVVDEIVDQSPDAAMGAIHLYRKLEPILIQPIYTTILVTLVSKALSVDEERKKAAQMAALCANVACLGYINRLNNQKQRLSKKQFTVLQNHPEQSMLLLKRAGCENKLCLETIYQHHERNDGSGYPRKLPGSKILDIAKLLSVADTYLAMTGKRCYRESYVAKGALREVYANGVSSDQVVYLSFIKELGIFPPGTFVRLENGEIAVVTCRGAADPMSPSLKAVVNAKGAAYKVPFARDCKIKQYSIKETCAMTTDLAIPLDVIWDFKKA